MTNHRLNIERLEQRCLLAGNVIDYPWPATVPQSTLYDVKAYANGVEVDLFTHYSEPMLEQGPDGDGVTGVLEDRSMSFVQFAFSGVIDIEVEKLYGQAATRVEISPTGYGIEPYYFDGRIARFRLENMADRTEYISVNFVSPDNLDSDGSGGTDIKNGLMLFGDAPEVDVPSPTDPGVVVYSDSVTDSELAAADVIYFPPGDYDLETRYPANPRKASLPISQDGQEVYVAGGAFVRGGVHGDGNDNLKVYGRGIFSGGDLHWHEIRDDDGTKDAFLKFQGTSDSEFSGFIIVNPTHHAMPSSFGSSIENIKIIGWASNHDGIRPGSDSLVEGVFLKTSDDLNYARNDHTVQDSVIWPMRNGAFGQLGWNNLGVGGTTFVDNYFINSEWNAYNRNRGIIGSVLNQGVDLANNLIENIYAENRLSLLANITIEYDTSEPWDPNNPGEVTDFTFRNIIIDDFTAANGAIVKNPIHGFERDGVKAMVKDIEFINVVAGNELITAANYATYFDLDPNTTSNITFTQEGTIHSINATAGPNGTVTPSGNVPTPEGMNRTINIIADPGYRIENVVVDGVDMGRMQNVTFSDVIANHTVTATFVPGDDFYELDEIFTPPLNGVLLYEPFEYGTGLGEGSSFIGADTDFENLGPWFVVPGADGTDGQKIYQQRLAPYTDGSHTLPEAGSAAYLSGNQGPITANLDAPLAFADGETVWLSFVAALTASYQQSWVGFEWDSGGFNILLEDTNGTNNDGFYSIGIGQSANDVTANAATDESFASGLENQNLLIAKIVFDDAGPESISVYANPSDLFAGPGTAIAELDVELGSTLSALTLNSDGALESLQIDEIRIARDYLDVVSDSLLPGDFDGDNFVTGLDFLAWQRGVPAIFDGDDLIEWEENHSLNNAEVSSEVTFVVSESEIVQSGEAHVFLPDESEIAQSVLEASKAIPEWPESAWLLSPSMRPVQENRRDSVADAAIALSQQFLDEEWALRLEELTTEEPGERSGRPPSQFDLEVDSVDRLYERFGKLNLNVGANNWYELQLLDYDH